VWQAVHVPIVPSSFGLPTLWHCAHPLVVAELEALGEFDLLRRQPFLAEDGGPGRRGVPAAEVLLVDGLVTAPAVGRGQVRGNHKAVVILFRLRRARLMAVEAVDAFRGVHAHLVLVHD
jgi:hypothetical protein